MIEYEKLHPELGLGLLFSDLDPSEKQHHSGCLRLADIAVDQKTGRCTAVNKVRQRIKEVGEYRGLYLYLEFLHKYACLFSLEDMKQ